MKKEITLGKRVLVLECGNNKVCEAHDEFLNFLLKNDKIFIELFNEYKIPEQIIVNFTRGDGKLAGKYYVQKKNVREHIIIVDIYTEVVNENDFTEIIDTFVHEIVHNKIKGDIKTGKIAKKIVRELLGKGL